LRSDKLDSATMSLKPITY